MKLCNNECIYFVLNGQEDEEMLKHTLPEKAPEGVDVYYLCLLETRPNVPVPVTVIICANDSDMEQMKFRLRDAYYGSAK